MMFVFLGLGFLSQNDYFQLHPFTSQCYTFNFHGSQMLSIVQMHSIFIIRRSADGHLGCLHFLVPVNRAAMNRDEQVSPW